jgi:hypothetical protein
MCISNKIGPPVEGDDFFGREKEIKQANRLLRMLENDGYTLKKDSVRAFRSPLLRDYWYHAFVE